MNWLDIVLASIIGVSVLAGLWKGMMRVGIGLATLVAGLLLAAWFHGMAGSFLTPYVSHKSVANMAGFVLVFVAVQVLGVLIAMALDRLFKRAGIKWLDRLLGGAFGLLRGLLLAIVLVMAIMAFSVKPPPESVVHSRMAPYILEASRIMAAVTPHEVRDGYRTSYEKVRKIWEEVIKNGVRALPEREI